MVKSKLIVNIDGPRGIGKTTQIGLLSRKLSETYKVHANIGLVDYDRVLNRMNDAIEKLDQDFDIIINEGSFFRPIAEDFYAGLTQTEVLNKHRATIAINERSRHQYRTVNIIMYSDDVVALQNRLIKHFSLIGQKHTPFDTNKEADLIESMVGFEKSMVTLNANTQVLNVHVDMSILEVNEVLEKEITSFF